MPEWGGASSRANGEGSRKASVCSDGGWEVRGCGRLGEGGRKLATLQGS